MFFQKKNENKIIEKVIDLNGYYVLLFEDKHDADHFIRIFKKKIL